MHGTFQAVLPPRKPKLLLLLFIAMIGAAFVVEIVDPAPLSIEASVASP